MTFRNMSTKMRLLASFGAIVIFNICFGLYSIHSLAVMNARVVESNEWAVGIAQAAEIHMYASSARRLDLNYEQTDNLEQRKRILEYRTSFIEKLVALLKVYKEEVLALPYDSEDLRELDIQKIDELTDNWNAYDAMSRSLTEAVDAGRKEKVDEILEASFQVYQTLESSIQVITQYNVDGGVAAMELSEDLYSKTSDVIVLLLILANLFSIAVTFVITRGIRRSIDELLRVSESLQNCDLRVSAKVFTKDEFGTLARSYNLMIENFKTLIAGIQESAKWLAEAAGDLNDNVSKSSGVTDTIVKKIENVSAQTSNQQGEIQSITKTMDDLSGGIDETSTLLDSLARLSSDSVAKAKEGSLSIEQAISHIDVIEQSVNSSAGVVAALGERSDEIGRIVETISGISSQTNLLALNAAIEAARAGEQGKGFAVVADEVKNLAGESRTAANEIAKLIASIQEETSKAVEAMKDGKGKVKTGSEVVRFSGHAFSELTGASVKSYEQLQSITGTMHNMASQAADIVSLARGVESSSQKIADNSKSVESATQEQAAATHEISDASNQLASIAQEMLNSIQQFTI